MSEYEREMRAQALLGIEETARAHAEQLRGWERWLALIAQAHGDTSDITTVARSASDECERLAGAFRYLGDAAARDVDQVLRS
jgi:hypothetical protein